MTSIASKRNLGVVLATLLSLGFAAPALSGTSSDSASEQPAKSEQDMSAMQKLQAKRQEIRQVTGKLRQIQREATQANPDLQAEQKDFRDLVVDTMSTDDYDPSAEIQDIRNLQTELQNGGGDLAQEERQAKTQELNNKKKQFRSKQQAALQDEEVEAARRELDQKMEAAMTKQDPTAGDLIAKLEELQQEYKDILHEAIRQQQQGNNATQGDGQG